MNESEALFVRRCLLDAGLAEAGDPISVEPLGGGVSNDVYDVRCGERRWVLKRALPKLRVEAEWLSDVDRVHREAACQRWLAKVLEPGAVPAVVWEDLDRHVYLMDRAPLDSVNWKAEMLAGRVDPDAAARAGAMLGRLHAAGRDDRALREQLGDKTVFDQLRLDPYLRTIARVHPDLAAAIAPLIERCAGSEETLVHGDYSPKNILLQGGRNILLDHEVAHIGEPYFDLGFFFTHLFLKPLHLDRVADALWAQVPRAWEAYRSGYPGVAEADWLPYLGAMLLARVDGKSPAEYLTADQRVRVRRLARPLIRGEAGSLAEALALGRRV